MNVQFLYRVIGGVGVYVTYSLESAVLEYWKKKSRGYDVRLESLSCEDALYKGREDWTSLLPIPKEAT